MCNKNPVIAGVSTCLRSTTLQQQSGNNHLQATGFWDNLTKLMNTENLKW